MNEASAGVEKSRFSKHRAEALSDAVFPIAMTVLVLNLKVPVVASKGQLWTALEADSPLWYSVVLTFGITSMFWMLQHRVFDAVDALSTVTMRLTILCLGFVTVLPFTTSLLGHAKGDPLAFELYFTNMSAIALTMALKLEWARKEGAFHAGALTERTRMRVWRITLVMLSAAVSARYLPLKQLWLLPIAAGFFTRGVWWLMVVRKAGKRIA